jgi:uncharacterized membrane protein (UPF0136 family)
MNALKGVATGILSFILFLTISLFGVAYLLHSTVLNPDFVADQVDNVDVSAVIEDVIDENAGMLPDEVAFLEDHVGEIVDAQEPWLKEQLHTAIYAGYDFILSETDELAVTISLASLKADLQDDLWTILNDQLDEVLPELLGQELRPYLNQNWDEVYPLLEDQFLPPGGIGLTKDELLPFLDDYLRDIEGNISQEINDPQVAGLINDMLRPYYDEFYGDFAADIPDELSFSEADLDADIYDALLTVRKAIGYFQTGYWVSIIVMVVLAGAIFAINRDIRHTCRALGISLTIYGVLELAGVIIAKAMNPMKFITDVPAWLTPIIDGIYSDVTGILLTYSIIILVIGIILLVVSFVYKRREKVEI